MAMAADVTTRRPISVTLAAWLFVIAGTVGLAAHWSELAPAAALAGDAIWVVIVRVLAIVAGVFLLRGAPWARWLALAWLAYHVALGAAHSPFELAVHAVFLVVVAAALLHRAANAYFGRANPEPAAARAS
jgi:uncharacterized membrane protein